MDTLSYLIFGTKREYQVELSFSVLSAVRYLRRDPADIRLVLVTEEGTHRLDLPVEHVHFSRDEFQSWCGAGNNVHRVKEFALLKVLEHYKGKVAHIDPDTYFIDHPRELFARISADATVMHENEGPLGSFPIWEPLLNAGVREVHGYTVSPDSSMFNSGVIGLTYENRHLLMESVALEDALFRIAWVFNIEQFATGAVLGKHTRLTDCKDVLTHYWGPERHFINAQCDVLFRDLTQERFEALVEAPTLPRVGFPRMALLDRIAARILIGMRARDGDYRFAYLAGRSAVTSAAGDARSANVWARIALDGLGYTISKPRPVVTLTPDQIRSDFRAFSRSSVRTLGWLDRDLARAWMSFWDRVEADPLPQPTE